MKLNMRDSLFCFLHFGRRYLNVFGSQRGVRVSAIFEGDICKRVSSLF
jgi:hypothetical protein